MDIDSKKNLKDKIMADVLKHEESSFFKYKRDKYELIVFNYKGIPLLKVLLVLENESVYMLNLKSLKPTKNSKGQYMLSKETLVAITNYLDDYNSFSDKSGLMTEYQKKKFLLWEDIIDIRNDMVDENPASLETLIISLYTFMPPRELEYFNMYFIDKYHAADFIECEEKNYCVYDGNKIYFIINVFRMEYMVGSAKYDVSTKLNEIILKYVKKNKIQNDELLLNISRESKFEAKLQQIFDKKTNGNGFSTEILRIAYSTWILLNSPKISQGEWKKISYLMGYSIAAHIRDSKHMDTKKAPYGEFKKEIQDVIDIKIYEDNNSYYYLIDYD